MSNLLIPGINIPKIVSPNKWSGGLRSTINSLGRGLTQTPMGGTVLSVGTDLLGNVLSGGNSTGIGNLMQGAGGIVGMVNPIAGAVVSGVGSLINGAFGSNINEDFVNQTRGKIDRQLAYTSNAQDFTGLMNDWNSFTDIDNVTKDQVGSDGLFSNKASRTTNALNKDIDNANFSAWNNISKLANNINTNNYLSNLAHFGAYGGPINMKYTGTMSPFGNQFGDGGGIYIKPENRGKFTALKERTGKSATWFKEHGTPAQKKMATFALNSRKWKHDDGGPLDSLVADINRRSKADFVQRLLDPNRTFIKDWESDNIATHKLGWATDDKGAIVFPNVQRINGKLYDFTDPKNKRGEWDALDSAIERGDTLRMTPVQAEEFTKTYKKYYPKGKTFKAFGGELTHGGVFSNNVLQVNEGGTHQENPYDGIQLGVDEQGIPNLVEEGEIIFNDYVFSNRLKVPKAVRQKYKLRENATYADAAKKLQKESEERPNDPISTNGLNVFMNDLRNSQEEQRIKKEKKNNIYDIGGSLRYAPIAGAALSVVNDMTGGNNPDYTNADLFKNAIQASNRQVGYRPIGQYLRYEPLDTDYYISRLDANASSGRRAMQNMAGGNRATAQAGILGSDYNYITSLGQLARQAEEYNQAQKQKVAEFNRATDQYNSDLGTRVDMFNTENAIKRAQMYNSLATMRQSIYDRNRAERIANLTNFIQGLGDYGRESTDRDTLRWLADLGVVKYDTKGRYTGGK